MEVSYLNTNQEPEAPSDYENVSLSIKTRMVLARFFFLDQSACNVVNITPADFTSHKIFMIPILDAVDHWVIGQRD